MLQPAGDKSVTLQVWDIGGQTLGGKMLENYIYCSNVSYIIRMHALCILKHCLSCLGGDVCV